MTNKIQRVFDELLRYPNHPLKFARQICPGCRGFNVQAPAYPGDYFDCLDCGHSIAPTKKQIERMNGCGKAAVGW